MTEGTRRYQLSRRLAWFANPRTDADGDVRHGAHLAALQAKITAERTRTTEAASAQTASPRAMPTATGPQWNPLGPAGVGLGQADGRPRVSGRVTSIAASPDGQRAYIGTANGGTWYTDDAGTALAQPGHLRADRVAHRADARPVRRSVGRRDRGPVGRRPQ